MTFTYKDHEVIINGYDLDEDGSAQTVMIYVDNKEVNIENGPLMSMIRKYIDENY